LGAWVLYPTSLCRPYSPSPKGSRSPPILVYLLFRLPLPGDFVQKTNSTLLSFFSRPASHSHRRNTMSPPHLHGVLPMSRSPCLSAHHAFYQSRSFVRFFSLFSPFHFLPVLKKDDLPSFFFGKALFFFKSPCLLRVLSIVPFWPGLGLIFHHFFPPLESESRTFLLRHLFRFRTKN